MVKSYDIIYYFNYFFKCTGHYANSLNIEKEVQPHDNKRKSKLKLHRNRFSLLRQAKTKKCDSDALLKAGTSVKSLGFTRGNMTMNMNITNVSSLWPSNSTSRHLLRDTHKCEKQSFFSQRYLKWQKIEKKKTSVRGDWLNTL